MLRILTFLLMLVALSLPALAKRVALVIGNGEYKFVTPLINPTNDAALMESALKTAGFEVMRRDNLDQQGMRLALVEFSRKLKQGAEAGMFYYAGHGVEIDGKNYLVPIDSNMQSKEEADVFNFDVNSFLAMMENSGVPFNIMVLDACRNNPFRGLRATGGGLAPLRAPVGSYVAYATAPGSVAADGQGANSPFTEALATSMATPGLSLEEVFKQTRTKVRTATGGSQVPFDSSAIEGNFFFTPAVEKEVAVASNDGEAAFNAAGDDISLLTVVAEEFSASIWGRVARERIKSIESAARSAAQDRVALATPPPDPVQTIAPPVAVPLPAPIEHRSGAKLGVQITVMTSDIAKSVGLETLAGAYVISVEPGSLAEAAGINAKDTILSFNQMLLTDAKQLPGLVLSAEIGSTVPIKVWRDRKELLLEVVIRVQSPVAALAAPSASQPVPPLTVLGMTVEKLAYRHHLQFKLNDNAKGLIITSVDSGSPAFAGGLIAGDVITEAGAEPAANPDDILTQIEKSRRLGGTLVLLTVMKKDLGGQERYATVQFVN